MGRLQIRDPLGRLINILQHELPDRSDTAKCRETVSVLADVQNIYYTTKQIHHCHFNYSAFWLKATENRRVVNAVAYAIDRGDARQRQFQKILSSIGFNIKLKPYIQRADGSTKGDWDIGITLDALDFAKRSDTIVLVSGDGDFDLLVNKIRNDYSARVEVYSVSQLTAASLKNAATEHFAIENELLLRE